jgi:hypothetical protein
MPDKGLGESSMANKGKAQITPGALIALRGLRLPRVTLERLKQSGIRCIPELSIERQRTSRQYVIRSQESGGAIAELGAYCGYVADTGSPLGWLQRLDSLGVNGVHARAVSATLARIQVVRVRHTYDLLISRHVLQFAENKPRPTLQNTIIFLGRQGTLELDLWDKDNALCGAVSPVFYDRGGEAKKIPTAFEAAARCAVAGANCCGCHHVHLLEPPQSDELPLPGRTHEVDSGSPTAGMD